MVARRIFDSLTPSWEQIGAVWLPLPHIINAIPVQVDWMYRTGARVFSVFGAIALLLAVVGVYGVKSYVVSRRTREFGIRIATGAHPRALLWQVLREGSRTTAAGVGI